MEGTDGTETGIENTLPIDESGNLTLPIEGGTGEVGEGETEVPEEGTEQTPEEGTQTPAE